MGDLKKKKYDYTTWMTNGKKIETEVLAKSTEYEMLNMLRTYMELFYEKQIEKVEEEKMARYRTYKNGITGHRYRGYYIIKGEKKGLFQIWKNDKTVYQDHIYDYDECEWIIDKATVSDEEMSMIKQLYEMEIYQLSSLFIELMQKKEREGLDQKDLALYKWVKKVRKRKAEDRLF